MSQIIKNNNWVAETERLRLREFREEDAEFIYQLNLDKEVMHYTGDLPFNSIDEARDFLLKYDHYKKYSFGRWLVINKSSSEPLGWCGLKYSSSLDEYDVGFRFSKQHWGQGYATEAAKVCVHLAFQKYGIKLLLGRAMKENKASIQVLKKLGMEFVKEAPCGEEPGLVFQLKIN